MGCNKSQEERDPPKQEMRSVVVFNPESQETATVQISADGESIQDHPSEEVDHTWKGKTIYVYCDDPNPPSHITTHYSISEKVLEDSPLYLLGTIKVDKHWHGQGTERKLYIGKIPQPASVPRT